MFEELVGGGVGDRQSRCLAAAAHAHPAGFQQRIDHRFRHRDAAHGFDLGARHRLAVSDDRHRLQRCLAELFLNLAFFDEEVGQILRRLETPLAGHFHEVHAALGIDRAQRHQHFARLDALRQDFGNLLRRQRFPGREQNSLGPAHAFCKGSVAPAQQVCLGAGLSLGQLAHCIAAVVGHVMGHLEYLRRLHRSPPRRGPRCEDRWARSERPGACRPRRRASVQGRRRRRWR